MRKRFLVPYAVLALAVLWLNAGRTAEVKELAIALGWIFKAQGIDREALAALKLFCDAARQESATVELAELWVRKGDAVSAAAAVTRRPLTAGQSFALGKLAAAHLASAAAS